MPLIDLTLQHGRTLDEARRRLEATVTEATSRFGSMIQRVEWAPDRNRVKVEGVGFWVEMSVDATALRAVGDIPVLGRLLGSQLVSGLRQIVEQTFQKKLPGVWESWSNATDKENKLRMERLGEARRKLLRRQQPQVIAISLQRIAIADYGLISHNRGPSEYGCPNDKLRPDADAKVSRRVERKNGLSLSLH